MDSLATGAVFTGFQIMQCGSPQAIFPRPFSAATCGRPRYRRHGLCPTGRGISIWRPVGAVYDRAHSKIKKDSRLTILRGHRPRLQHCINSFTFLPLGKAGVMHEIAQNRLGFRPGAVGHDQQMHLRIDEDRLRRLSAASQRSRSSFSMFPKTSVMIDDLQSAEF